jgi:oligosaccharide repeat unit polymerase
MAHFVYDWYKLYKKTGMTLDYWTMSMSLIYLMPFLIMYPFSSSFLNVMAVGENIILIQNNIDICYLIFLIGYTSMYAGRYIFDRYQHKTIIYLALIKPFKKTLGKLFVGSVTNIYTSTIIFLIYIVSLLAIIGYARSVGAVDVRGVFQANPEIRALYNFVLMLSSVVSLVLISRVFQYNKLLDKVLLFGFFLATIFIGARAYLAQPIIYLFGFYVFFTLKGKINLLKVFGIGFFVLCIGVGLNLLRTGDFSLGSITEGFGNSIFFGNSYSDLRDFAWVYGYWDKSLLFGKTYLAGFMSFVPSFLSDFRTQWAAGRFTAVTVGFDPLEHPGLRPGLFGESYFNFGVFGVVILGTILGYAYRYIDYKIKIAAQDNDKLTAIASVVSTMFIFNLTITSGFFSLYVFLIVLIMASSFSKILTIMSK